MTAARYQEIVDDNGRVYRIGETPHDIMGRSRSWMVWLPWIAMMAVSVFEYGWGAVEGTLEEKYGWTLSDAFWLASIWAVFQAAVAFPAGRLREKNIVSAKTAMLAGAVCSAIGYFTISHSGNLVLAFAGYSVLGGIGAGLVYATCINMVGKWYPEKRGARTGFVNGGFAYGAVPFIYVFAAFLTPANYSVILDVIGVYMLIAVGICGFLFKDPPKSWWPARRRPAAAGRDRQVRRTGGLAKNPPAVKQFSPMEAIRTGMLPLMWICLVIIGGVSLFGINFQVPFAKDERLRRVRRGVFGRRAGDRQRHRPRGRRLGVGQDRAAADADPRAGDRGRRAVRCAVRREHAQPGAVHGVRVPDRVRRRRVLPAVRRAGAGLLRREQQRRRTTAWSTARNWSVVSAAAGSPRASSARGATPARTCSPGASRSFPRC